MQIRAAISKDGSQVFIRDEASGQLVQRSNAAMHPFLRGLDGMSNVAGDKLTRPYAHSVWVQRAIKSVADPIATVALGFFERGADGNLDEVKEPALAAFWETPAIDRSGLMERADFIEACTGWLKLAGEFFLILDDTWLTQRFATTHAPLIIARPDRMRPILQNNRLAGWEWTDATGQRHALLAEQVIHRKLWNPYDDLRGLGEYEAAKTASECDYLAGKFALNMNRANGDRGVIVVAKGGIPSDPQQEQITRALREKANAAREGNFRPIFLSGDVAIEDPKIAAPDANFVAGRLQSRHEIFIAFGVPPSMADLVANYSIGAASDWHMLIVKTCIPLANGKLAGAVSAVSRRFFPGGRSNLIAQFDFDDHPVIQQVRRERIDTGTKLWDRGVPWDKVSDHLDLGLPQFEGSDKGYLPFNLAPVDAESPLPTSDAQPVAPKPEEDPVELMRLAFAGREPVLLLQDAFTADAGTLQIGARKTGERDPARVRMANAHLRSRGPAIKRARNKFSKSLMAARREVLGKLEAAGRKATTKAAAADFLFDLAGFKATLIANMRKASEMTLQEAGQQLYGEVPGMKDDVFTMPPAEAHRFLQQRENLLSGVADDVFDKVRKQLQEGIDAGESHAQLASRVRTAFNGIEDGRALTIAQTEVGAAYGEARQVAMDEAGIEWKEWLTSGLATVRATHRDAEGQRARTNDAFHIGAVHLIAPGIPAGPGDNDPGEIINCHCVSIPVDGPGDEKSNQQS